MADGGRRAHRRPGRRRLGYAPPGVLCLLRHRDAVLLIEGAPRKSWAGRWGGIGGAVEPGEHPLRAALREIHEETGLRLVPEDLRFKGAVHSEGFYGESKVMLVVTADVRQRRVRAGEEGRLRWVPLRTLSRRPNLVPDLYTLIPRVLTLRPGEFLSGVAVYDGAGEMVALDLVTAKC